MKLASKLISIIIVGLLLSVILMTGIWLFLLVCNPGAPKRKPPPLPTTTTTEIGRLHLGHVDAQDFSGLEFHDQTEVLYVYGFQEVVEVDTRTFTELDRLRLPGRVMVYDLAISPDGDTFALADWSGFIIILKAKPLHIIKRISVACGPMHIHYSNDGKRIYYTASQQNRLGYVSLNDERESKTVIVKGSPSGIACSDSRLYVGYDAASHVTAHDLDTLKSIQTIPLPASAHVSRQSTVGTLDFGPSEVAVWKFYLFVQSPVEQMLWRVDLNSGKVDVVDIGYGTSGLKILRDSKVVSPGDSWEKNTEYATSIVGLEPFKVKEIVATNDLQSNAHLTGSHVFDAQAEVLYQLYSTDTDIYLGKRVRIIGKLHPESTDNIGKMLQNKSILW